MAIESATLGGGCFWCIDSAFRRVKGVTSVMSGYAGGERPNPSYEQICTGATGHAEVVQVEFDNAIISYQTLLELFFDLHDPTTLNRQGADVGTQYRSVIFYHSDEQRQCAQTMIAALNARGGDSVVTQVQALPAFYPAEAYHQDYYENNPQNRYCQLVINPKLAKFMAKNQNILA